MNKYSQLNLQKRHQIEALLEAGHNQSEIARTIGVHRSTISRELKRNVANNDGEPNTYCPDTAQQLIDQHHRSKPKHRRFSQQLKGQARRWLTVEKLSSELISGRWDVMGIDGVSHETIYQWLWAAKQIGDPTDKNLYRHLKHGRRKRRRGNLKGNRGRIKGRVPIIERPKVVEERSRLGDIEVDLMMGKAHKSAQPLGQIPFAFIKTLTFENDKAFARHQDIADLLDTDTTSPAHIPLRIKRR